MHPPIISIISQYTTAYNLKIEKFDKKISRKGLKERILKFFYLEEVFKTRFWWAPPMQVQVLLSALL